MSEEKLLQSISKSSTEEVDTATILLKLLGHLKVDKKFARAALIFVQILDAKLNELNSSVFYDTICQFMSECERDVLDKRFSGFYGDIFNSIQNKEHLFTKEEQYRLKSFTIFARTRNELLTDDSFKFAEACRKVQEMIESPASYENSIQNEENLSDKVVELSREELGDQVIERQRVLLAAIETSCQNNRWTWAQQPIESLIRAASERRYLFNPTLREELDGITERITLVKRKNVCYTGLKKVKVSNSIAHPLFSKKYDTII